MLPTWTHVLHTSQVAELAGQVLLWPRARGLTHTGVSCSIRSFYGCGHLEGGFQHLSIDLLLTQSIMPKQTPLQSRAVYCLAIWHEPRDLLPRKSLGADLSRTTRQVHDTFLKASHSDSVRGSVCSRSEQISNSAVKLKRANASERATQQQQPARNRGTQNVVASGKGRRACIHRCNDLETPAVAEVCCCRSLCTCSGEANRGSFSNTPPGYRRSLGGTYGRQSAGGSSKEDIK